MDIEKQNAELEELKRLRGEASQARKVVFPGLNSDLHARIQESEQKFEFPYARLFPLIGEQVMTPQGPGELLTVRARECEVLPVGKNAQTFRVKPDEVSMIGGEFLVAHEEQEAMHRYMEFLEHIHVEQRKRAKG